jgi:flagellin
MNVKGFSSFRGFSPATQMNETRRALNASLERLATGKRVNRAADDPAGLMAITAMDAQRRSISERIKSFEASAYTYGAKDGALGVLGDLVAELDGLVVSAANRGGMSEGELNALQIEADSILGAIDDIAFTSRFKDQLLLSGFDANNLGTGVADGVSLRDLLAGGSLNLSSGDLEQAQAVVKEALSTVATARGAAGAEAQAIDAQIRAMQEEMTNLADAQSMIQDVDYASEVSVMVRNQVMTQATQFVMMTMMDVQKQSMTTLLG